MKAVLVVIFASYLLLAFPVRGCVKLAVHGLTGTMTVELRSAGLRIARETKIALHSGKKKGRRWLFTALRRGARIERIEAFAQVGAGDAMHTALAASGVQAALLALLAPLAAHEATQVVVRPVFDGSCFRLRVRCIFSACAGDIMIAAAKAAIKVKRNEGERWSSIPSRT